MAYCKTRRELRENPLNQNIKEDSTTEHPKEETITEHPKEYPEENPKQDSIRTLLHHHVGYSGSERGSSRE